MAPHSQELSTIKFHCGLPNCGHILPHFSSWQRTGRKQDAQVRDEGGKRNQVFLTLVSRQTSRTKLEAVRRPGAKVLVTGFSVRRGQDSLAALECPWSCLLLFCFRCSYHLPLLQICGFNK